MTVTSVASVSTKTVSTISSITIVGLSLGLTLAVVATCCSQDRIHHILHGSLRILCSRSRARPQPHACRSSPSCSQDRILRIHHGSLRIHHIRSKAQPLPLACHSSPCILQDCIHHSLCTRRIHRIRSKAQLQHLPRLQAQQPQGPLGRELRASSCCQLLEWMST